MPIHTSTGLPSTRPATARAVGDRGDDETRRHAREQEPAAEQPRVGALGRDDVHVQVSAPRPTSPTTATTSSSRPASRIGPRISATGRHTIANAAPSSRPPARVGVDRYRTSILLMHRPPTRQYGAGVLAGADRTRGTTAADVTAMATAAATSHSPGSGSRRRRGAGSAIITNGHTR